jgi:hypothetical protein
MKRAFFAAAISIVALTAASLTPAETASPSGAGAATQAARDARMQEMSAQMIRLQSQLQQLNLRLVPMQVPQGFKDLGTGLGIACDRIRDADRHVQALRDDPAFAARPDRNLVVERLQDRLLVMNRELDEAHATLQRLVAMPVRPGSPLDAAEQMIRAQHQQEVEQVQKRVDERLKALDAWSKGDGVLLPAKDLVKDATAMRDRMRQLAQSCDKLCNDEQIELDRDRVREIDRVRDRVQVMLREIEEMADALERGVTA